MLTQDQVEAFSQDGFLNGGKVLSDAEATELSDCLDALMAKGPDGLAEDEPKPVLFHNMNSKSDSAPNDHPVYQIVNIWEAVPAFERLIYHPVIVKTISQLTGFGDLQVWHDQIQYKPQNHGGATTWHQDAPLWPTIEPMTPVSAWLPLDDANQDNGCMWMVPGSHRWGNQIEFLRTQRELRTLEKFKLLDRFEPPADAPVQEVRPMPRPVMRGEVHFHHSLTWHGSPNNFSKHPRRAIAIHFMTSQARFTGANHVMKQFINLEVGRPMREAGEHFPIVCLDGKPVGPPPRRTDRG